MKKLSIAAAAAVLATGAFAHGEATVGVAGRPADVTRTVHVDMTDTMRFKPDSVSVRRGETIRFVVKNSGRLKHEFVLGTEKELKAHYEQMKKFPEMEHAEPDMVTLAPGKTGEVTWQFTQSGKVDFACLQPGHYDAGMKGVVQVAAAGGALIPVADAAAPAGEMAEGEVRKVDKEAKKITLKHGEIKSLDMPGMTMVFQVKGAALLDAVKQGDKVRFKAERSGGAIVVTEIQPAK
jgi:uncharacterized cupredoxin-like copper-binding protein